MTVVIKGRGLENLAKHQYQYSGNTDALLALAKSWGYGVEGDAICFSSSLDVLQLLEDISDMGQCTTYGVHSCDWCSEFLPSDQVWHLDLMPLQRQRHGIDHICHDCAEEQMSASDFITEVLGYY